jgi:hypothetical protein
MSEETADPDAGTALVPPHERALARPASPSGGVARLLGIDPSEAEIVLHDEERMHRAISEAGTCLPRGRRRSPRGPHPALGDRHGPRVPPPARAWRCSGPPPSGEQREDVPRIALRVAKDLYENREDDLAASFLGLVQESVDPGGDEASAWAAQSLLMQIMQRSGDPAKADEIARDLAAHSIPLDLWRDDDPTLPDDSMAWHGGAFVGGIPPRRDERHLSYEDVHDYLDQLLTGMRREQEAEQDRAVEEDGTAGETGDDDGGDGGDGGYGRERRGRPGGQGLTGSARTPCTPRRAVASAGGNDHRVTRRPGATSVQHIARVSAMGRSATAGPCGARGATGVRADFFPPPPPRPATWPRPSSHPAANARNPARIPDAPDPPGDLPDPSGPSGTARPSALTSTLERMADDFVHLHTSTPSTRMLDGAATARRAHRRGGQRPGPCRRMAITDHGYVFGAFEFWSQADHGRRREADHRRGGLRDPGDRRAATSTRVQWGTDEPSRRPGTTSPAAAPTRT